MQHEHKPYALHNELPSRVLVKRNFRANHCATPWKWTILSILSNYSIALRWQEACPAWLALSAGARFRGSICMVITIGHMRTSFRFSRLNFFGAGCVI